MYPLTWSYSLKSDYKHFSNAHVIMNENRSMLLFRLYFRIIYRLHFLYLLFSSSFMFELHVSRCDFIHFTIKWHVHITLLFRDISLNCHFFHITNLINMWIHSLASPTSYDFSCNSKEESFFSCLYLPVDFNHGLINLLHVQLTLLILKSNKWYQN